MALKSRVFRYDLAGWVSEQDSLVSFARSVVTSDQSLEGVHYATIDQDR